MVVILDADRIKPALALDTLRKLAGCIVVAIVSEGKGSSLDVELSELTSSAKQSPAYDDFSVAFMVGKTTEVMRDMQVTGEHTIVTNETGLYALIEKYNSHD